MQGKDHLANEATEGVDADWPLLLVVSDVVDGHGHGVLLLFALRDHVSDQNLDELLDPLLLLEAHTALSASLLSLGSLLFLALLLVLEVFAALHFGLNRSLVVKGAASKTDLDGVLDNFGAVVLLDHLKLDLLVESRDQVGAHREGLLVPEQAQVFQLAKCVPLEVLQELLGHRLGDRTLLFRVHKDLVHALLEVATVDFVVAAGLPRLNSLSLHKHSLACLLVTCVMKGQHSVLMLFNDFDASLLEGLSDQNLQHWLNLKVEIEEVRVDVVDLDGLVVALLIRDVHS